MLYLYFVLFLSIIFATSFKNLRIHLKVHVSIMMWITHIPISLLTIDTINSMHDKQHDIRRELHAEALV